MNIHFIGIGGSAITPLAIMMKQLGHNVSGSDEGVFDPALTLLNSNKIDWWEGYDPKRIVNADIVIMGGAPLMKDPENPEYLEAKRLSKEIQGYAYLIQKYIVKKNSVVLAGSYGKSTTTGMVSWILENAGYDPSFMIGGKPENFTSGVKHSKSDYSVLEGDEFVSVYGMDMEPRFIYYKPVYTLISSAKWDHTNVYPTEESYVEAYYKLVDETSRNNGSLFLALSGENNEKVYEYAKKILKITTYILEGTEKHLKLSPDIFSTDAKFNEKGSSFRIVEKGEDLGVFKSKLIGKHNIENFTGAIAITRALGVDLEKIREGISTYLGIKRRLELIGKNSRGSIIIDDFAHSPMKAKASISAIRDSYPNKNVIAVYLPRISSLENREELQFYKNSFDDADNVIIPRIRVKRSVSRENRVYGGDICEVISESNKNVEYLPDETSFDQRLIELADESAIFLFMSAAGWGEKMQSVLDL